MIVNREEYRKKVLGCWMGKNIGGTLGAPFEWRRQVNDVSFYTQDLHGEPLPNDDLDIQLLWLVALEEMGVDLDAQTLSEYWVIYVTPHWAEYGNAKVNMRAGITPPVSGTLHNDFRHSCGAFIRSEIWACIAPGCPRVAARYAYEDAILDHGNGEGTYAEVFCAALESTAFVENDVDRLIEIGLSYIPSDCGVAQAIRCAMESYRAGKTWREARDTILEGYRGRMFFGSRQHISDEDSERGFGEGRLGWDAPSNVAIVVLGLLYGEGDFDKMMCTTVNCGEDTDCTGATVGSIFGIMHGIDAIPERWITPIGRGIKTACLNLGELGGFGSQLPQNVDELTARTERIARQVILRRNLPVDLAAGQATDTSGVSAEGLMAGDFIATLYESPNGPMHRFDFYDVGVDYGEDPLVVDGVAKPVRLKIRNRYKVQANVNVRWYAPEGWEVSPSDRGTVFVGTGAMGNTAEIVFELRTDRVRESLTRFAVELAIDGRPTVMLVPVALVNGNVVSVG